MQASRLESENQRKEKEQEVSGKQKDEPKTFVWKNAVDSLRDAAIQARQLSSFLGLLSRFSLTAPTISLSMYSHNRVFNDYQSIIGRSDTEKGKIEGSVALSSTSEKYQYPPYCILEGKIQHLTAARSGLMIAVGRLQVIKL